MDELIVIGIINKNTDTLMSTRIFMDAAKAKDHFIRCMHQVYPEISLTNGSYTEKYEEGYYRCSSYMVFKEICPISGNIINNQSENLEDNRE